MAFNRLILDVADKELLKQQKKQIEQLSQENQSLRKTLEN